MTRMLARAALVSVVTLIAAAAWIWAPDALVGAAAGEFPLLASLIGVFVALTALAWIEDRLARSGAASH